MDILWRDEGAEPGICGGRLASCCGWRHKLNRPIGIRPTARVAVMPGHEIDGGGFDGSAAFAAQAAEEIFKGHIALALYQQPQGIGDRTASAMQAMQLDHALRPIRQAVRFTKEGRVHPAIFGQEQKENKGACPAQVPQYNISAKPD
jgi:hypothetical protein